MQYADYAFHSCMTCITPMSCLALPDNQDPCCTVCVAPPLPRYDPVSYFMTLMHCTQGLPTKDRVRHPSMPVAHPNGPVAHPSRPVAHPKFQVLSSLCCSLHEPESLGMHEQSAGPRVIDSTTPMCTPPCRPCADPHLQIRM